jgi:hypothetical protein
VAESERERGQDEVFHSLPHDFFIHKKSFPAKSLIKENLLGIISKIFISILMAF